MTFEKANSQQKGLGFHYLLVLSMLMAFASLATDLYLPSMPEMERVLAVRPGEIELTISGYLVGFCIGQLFWGPVSDRKGRRVPVAIGLVLFILGSFGCAFAPSAQTMIAWRVVQAVGGSAAVVLARAMVRDTLSGPRAAHALSVMMAVMAIAPLIAPLLGGQIAALAGWRAIFIAMAAIAAVAFVLLFTMEETLPPARRSREPGWQAVRRYGLLLRNGRVMSYAAVVACLYCGLYAYIAGTPAAYITYFGVAPEHYGFLFGSGIIGIILTNMLNARVVIRVGIDRALLWGSLLAAVSGLALIGITLTDLGGLPGLVLALVCFASVTGFVVANAISGAMSEVPEHAGTVSALVGAFQYGSGIAGAGLLGYFADGTPLPMGIIIGLSGLGCLVSALVICRSRPLRR